MRRPIGGALLEDSEQLRKQLSRPGAMLRERRQRRLGHRIGQIGALEQQSQSRSARPGEPDPGCSGFGTSKRQRPFRFKRVPGKRSIGISIHWRGLLRRRLKRPWGNAVNSARR